MAIHGKFLEKGDVRTVPHPEHDFLDGPFLSQRWPRLSRLRFYRRLRLKEWHYMAFDHPEVFFAFAVVQAGYASNLFAYGVFKSAKPRCVVFEDIRLGSGALKVTSQPQTGVTRWSSPKGELAIEGCQEQGHWKVDFNLKAAARQKPWQGHLQVEYSPECLSLLYPLSASRWAHTHKEAALRVGGELQVADSRFNFDRRTNFAVSDWTRSYCLRKTLWFWASASWGNANESWGLNLSSRVYDDANGHSFENVLWVNGRCYPLSGVRFELPANPAVEPWVIRSFADNGASVNLTFHPIGARSKRLNLLLVRSRFVQPYGYFAGTVSVAGYTAEVQQAFGIVEEHHSVW
jgi:hypothetical protein